MRSTSPILIVLLLTASGLATRSARGEACVKCHVKPVEKATDPRVFAVELWEAGVHAGLACTRCHSGADAKAFDQLPHRLVAPPAPCMDCHDDDFAEIGEEYERSVHASALETFACERCHDPHSMFGARAEMPRAQRVEEANRACILCHRDAVLAGSGREGARGISEAHAWIPRPEAHAKMRCVVCHTPIDGSDVHEVLPSERAIRACDACHDVNAPLIAQYVDRDDPSSWVTNPLVFKEAYIPGATRNRVVDGFLVGLFWVVVAGVLAHALLRVLTRRNRPRMSATAEKVKMYPVWLRVWHWSNAILMIVLAYTGLRLHFGQQRGPVMSFETAFNVHNVAGVLLVLVGIVYLVGNLLGGNQRQYLSKPRDGLKGVWAQARWYLVGIFKGEPHPYHVGPEHKFNPLQHLTYVGVMYVVYPLLIVSGVALLFPDVLPKGVLGHPGAWWVAAVHWVLAAVAILFLVGHFYLGSMGDKVRDLYAAMLDGHHRHRRRKNP